MDKYHRTKKNGKQYLTHRLIMEEHIGRKLASSECVHHINGNKRDNRLENLVIVSRSEHAKEHFASGDLSLIIGVKGEEIKSAKFSNSEAARIKQKLHDGCNISKLAKELGVARSTLTRMKNGKHWSHL